jgi:hypothetical protein
MRTRNLLWRLPEHRVVHSPTRFAGPERACLDPTTRRRHGCSDIPGSTGGVASRHLKTTREREPAPRQPNLRLPMSQPPTVTVGEQFSIFGWNLRATIAMRAGV